MPFDAPFALGPFTVDRAGRLAPGGPGEFPCIRVVWRGRTVEMRMLPAAGEPMPEPLPAGDADGETEGALHMRVLIGRVPSTAGHPEGRPPPRAEMFALMRGLPATLPHRWGVTLLADHRIAIETTARLCTPAHASQLVTAITLFLLELSPYLDLVEESGIA